MENLYDKRIKARRGAVWLKVLWIILCSFIYFWVAELITLIIYQYAEFGFTTRNTHRVYRFLMKIKEEPDFVFTAYGLWFKGLLNTDVYSWGRFIPLLVPLLFLFIIFMGYMRNPHSFNLWYKLHNHFATLQEVLKMKVLGGGLMSLGKFEGKSLGINRVASLFGWGATELGKTSSVAVPSILESNSASVVAIDTDGTLFSHTSGHRGDLGRVFYFNWNLLDNPEKGEYWPRWNPLSAKDMPQKSEKRDLYLKRLAEHLLPRHDDEAWLKLSNMTIECLLNFFVCKIEQACANDYLLGRLLDNGHFEDEDKAILLSYYASMPERYTASAIAELNNDATTEETYFPVGSWDGIPAVWKGKELCLAMITDCLIQKYFLIKNSGEHDGWRMVVDGFLRETLLFGYSAKVVQGFEEILRLERTQRNILFMSLLEPLSIFRKENIRERTSSSDYSLKFGRGMRNNDGDWKVSTTYLVADNPESRFMTRLMADMLIERNMEKHKSAYRNPLLFVMDDLELLPRFDSLLKGVMQGYKTNLSFLLLTDQLKGLNEIYGKSGVEDIVSGCTYKLVFADNNIDLSRQFREMAVYGTKSVQIPAVSTGAFAKVKQGIADAYYYRKIADDLVSVRSNKKINKGEHLLLVEGFYNLPVKVDAKCFTQDVRLKTLSEKEAVYYLDENIRKKRNLQDVDVPQLLEVMTEIGEDNLLNDEMNERLENRQDEESAVLAEAEIVAKSDYTEENVAAAGSATDGELETGKSWWMEEDAFSLQDEKEENLPGKQEK